MSHPRLPEDVEQALDRVAEFIFNTKDAVSSSGRSRTIWDTAKAKNERKRYYQTKLTMARRELIDILSETA